MSSNSYSNQTRVQSSTIEAFKALTLHLGDWWGHQDHPASRRGDVFKVSWGEPWYQFKVIAYEPYKKIVWECIDANQIIGNLDGVQKEWVGTRLYWSIEKVNQDEVNLSLLHEGLVPDFICYDVCSRAWNRFITESLKEYLNKVTRR